MAWLPTTANIITQSSGPQVFVLSLAQTRIKNIIIAQTRNNAVRVRSVMSHSLSRVISMANKTARNQTMKLNRNQSAIRATRVVRLGGGGGLSFREVQSFNAGARRCCKIAQLRRYCIVVCTNCHMQPQKLGATQKPGAAKGTVQCNWCPFAHCR